jgi:hypothetical protein
LVFSILVFENRVFSSLEQRRLRYSGDGCHPTFFMVIPDKFRVDHRFKFTARISSTAPFLFSSRTIFARRTVAAPASAAV